MHYKRELVHFHKNSIMFEKGVEQVQDERIQLKYFYINISKVRQNGF